MTSLVFYRHKTWLGPVTRCALKIRAAGLHLVVTVSKGHRWRVTDLGTWRRSVASEMYEFLLPVEFPLPEFLAGVPSCAEHPISVAVLDWMLARDLVSMRDLRDVAVPHHPDVTLAACVMSSTIARISG